MHTLLFLEPGHFHATLTLRDAQPRVSDEVFVYARVGDEPREFLALVERFNGRAERPTRWRPVVLADADPLERLIAERRGDVVVLAGRNGGKARTMARLRDAGFHVLADKPWLVEPPDIRHVEASLAGWPLVMEVMTGRHDRGARSLKRLVDTPDIVGELRTDRAAIEIEGVHHLEKQVDGAPLRRPAWFFDVRVQGSGAVDIPTHVVDQTQWLVENTGVAPGEVPVLVAARGWSTAVPLEAFRRITGEAAFPGELRGLVEGDVLDYFCNAELEYRIGSVTAHASSCWRLSSPSGGVDTNRTSVLGTRADVVLERAGDRRLIVEPHGDAGRALAAVRRELPGVVVTEAGDGRFELAIPPALDPGHESHFALVLDEFLATIDDRRWPAALADRTLAKYVLLAQAAARVRSDGR
jgi:predicted dehydrogenase